MKKLLGQFLCFCTGIASLGVGALLPTGGPAFAAPSSVSVARISQSALRASSIVRIDDDGSTSDNGDDSDGNGSGSERFPTNPVDSGSRAADWGFLSTIKSNPCIVTVTVDEAAFSRSVPAMIKNGVFSDRFDSSVGDVAPHFLMVTAVADIMSNVVRDVFSQKGSPDACLFSAGYSGRDDYGNKKIFSIEDFIFEKRVYKKINWEHFEAIKIANLATKFDLNKDFADKALSEKKEALSLKNKDGD